MIVRKGRKLTVDGNEYIVLDKGWCGGGLVDIGFPHWLTMDKEGEFQMIYYSYNKGKLGLCYLDMLRE